MYSVCQYRNHMVNVQYITIQYDLREKKRETKAINLDERSNIMEKFINLETFANGALSEQLNRELLKTFDNVLDPNTNPTKKRTVTCKITLTPNSDERDVVTAQICTTSALAPVEGFKSTFVVGKDIKTGELKAAEFGNQIRGQMSIDEMDEEVPEKNNKVTDLRAVR
jgi:hypothetical protein